MVNKGTTSEKPSFDCYNIQHAQGGLQNYAKRQAYYARHITVKIISVQVIHLMCHVCVFESQNDILQMLANYDVNFLNENCNL